MAQIDNAFCHQASSVLSIYQVRDMHFDEDDTFDANTASFECVGERCSVELRGVNHKAVKFKRVPHFRVLKGHDHSDECDFEKEAHSDSQPNNGVREKEGYKDTNYPAELLLERMRPPRGSGKPSRVRDSHNESDAASGQRSKNGRTPHQTSCLEHIVGTFLRHGKEVLRSELLTIGENTWYYPNAFKPIKWFYKDPPGFIYWGKVKKIQRYAEGYSIIFSDWPYYQGKPRQVGIYLKDELIEGYRKRRLFRSYIDALLPAPSGQVDCYFVGAYPTLKGEPVILRSGKSFTPLEVHLTNLDHLLLWFNEEEEGE